MEDTFDSVFKALANPVRRSILDALRGSPRTTGDLVEGFPTLSRFAVMKHLDVLVDSSLVTVTRQGRQRFNHLNPAPIRLLYERWMTPFSELWAREAVRLKRHVEQETGKG
ncbi:MAG: ArsR/SmtB family transcription factor [Acidimicrobiia bacterium]